MNTETSQSDQLSETVSPSLIEESSSEGFTAMTSQSTPAGKGKGKLSTKDSPSTSGRQTKSLEILTPKFIDCIFESNGQIDLNDVSTRLGVQKRRIYDMMNILEGIGVVVKSDKMIKMACGQGSVDLTRTKVEEELLFRRLCGLRDELRRLRGDPDVTTHLYLPFSDIIESHNDFHHCNVIGVSLPELAELSVATPEPRLQMECGTPIGMKFVRQSPPQRRDGEGDAETLFDSRVEYPLTPPRPQGGGRDVWGGERERDVEGMRRRRRRRRGERGREVREKK